MVLLKNKFSRIKISWSSFQPCFASVMKSNFEGEIFHGHASTCEIHNNFNFKLHCTCVLHVHFNCYHNNNVHDCNQSLRVF